MRSLVQDNKQGAGVGLINLGKTYGEDVAAVEDVNLDINPGEFLTLLGPSGSGKTTTLAMVAGFEQPSRGEIKIDDKCVTKLPPHKRDIGMVFQNYALFPHMTVEANVGYPLRIRRWEKSRISEAVQQQLKLVRLEGLAQRLPSQLSGGQQQRVALARATVFRPRLLLMDEPLGALDRQLRQTLQFEIKAIQARLGVTVVNVTHDQEEALTMSDRIAVMRDGRIEQLGSPQEIYDHPVSDFVANFIGETNLFPGTRTAPTVDGSAIDIGGGRTLFTTRTGAVGSRVTVSVRPERIAIIGNTLESPRPNQIQAVVEASAYTGAGVRYVLKCGDLPIIVRAENEADVHLYPPGTQVTLKIDPRDVVVVSDAG